MEALELVAWRAGRGWTVARLASELGVAKITAAQYLSGRRAIPLWISKLVAALDRAGP